jgi:hypothetical protein
MIICATMDVVLSNLQRRITYIDFGTLPGGPQALPASLHATTIERVRFFVRLLDNSVISGVLVSVTLASYVRYTPSFVQVWRVLALWGRNLSVKVITLFLYVIRIGK